MNFYTNVDRYGEMILYRGIENGKRIKPCSFKYQPTLFVTTPNGSWRGLDGTPVEPIQKSSMRATKEFIDKPIAGQRIYGNIRYPYCFINDNFPGNIEFDRSLINVTTIDIEVASDDGFPHPEDALKEVTAITLKNNIDNTFYTWGCGDYEVKQSIMTTNRVVYTKCQHEQELLNKFIEHWTTLSNTPDVITGWNSRYFDIPYLVTRIGNIMPGKEQFLSPHYNPNRNGKVVDYDRKGTRYCHEIKGIEQLDYMELFKKFSYQYGPQESYSLNHISYVVLGEHKLNYDEHNSLHAMYVNDHQKFIDYNIRDVDLVDRMEDKLGLITLALTMAYRAGVNYMDTLGTTAMWDSIIYRDLYSRKIAVPMITKKIKSAYPGGYVKEPHIGMHDYVVSFDLNSLYPSIIMQYNMSPETISEGETASIDVDKILEDPSIVNNRGKAVTASGQYFNLDKPGVMARIVAIMYTDRVKIKKAMIESRKELETVDPENKQEVYRIERDIAHFENEQMTLKLLLNSLYGAMGNRFFRFFDQRIATAITLTGQLTIRWAEVALNKALNKILKTEDKDYVIAMDTDSLYVNLGSMVEKLNPKNPVDFLDKACNELEKHLAESYDELFKIMGGTVNKMVMSREVIADRGIWTAKKRYILNVYDNEGVRYTVPKLKIMGIEAIKSSTPEPCRKALKRILNIIVAGDQEDTQKSIQQFREYFRTLKIEDIATPRGITNLKKFRDYPEEPTFKNIYKKGTPIHVRGGILYNKLLEDHTLEKRYRKVGNDEKIKYTYLRIPNPMQQNVISFPDYLPKEFKLHKYIDYDLQFQKTFLDAIDPILKAIGWSSGDHSTLEAFFK